ncbi:MAG: AI-2E family transporter [Lachnospiraceae bacterium]|nr:AI-2E family transporter [Lachnospiraceae bacterium]
MDLGKQTIKNIRGLIVFTILIFVSFWNLDIVLEVLGFIWSILFPFAVGGAIAFIINVPMSFMEKRLFRLTEKENKKAETKDAETKRAEKKKKILQKSARPVSLLLTIVLVMGVIILVIFFVVPQLGRTFGTLGDNIAAFIPKMQEWIREFSNNNQEIMQYVNQLEFNPDESLHWMMSFLESGAGSVMNTTFAAAKGLLSGTATFIIAFVFGCYILLQKEKMHIQARKVLYAFLPKSRAEAVLKVCALTYKTFSNFLTGQCLEAVLLGCMFLFAMTIFKMPYALLIGVLIAFSALIPIFGAFLGCGVGTFLIFMVNPRQAIWFVVLFLIIQQIEGNFVYPHVVGSSVGLPSVWVLAAVSVGGRLMGVVGMLIFIPIVSVCYTLFWKTVHLKLKEKKIKEVTAQMIEEEEDGEEKKRQCE